MRHFFEVSALLLILIVNFATVHAAELLMFEHQGCIACKQFKAEVLPGYLASDFAKKLPIRSIVYGDKAAYKGIELKGSPFYFSPTFILVENGKELARIRGYAGKKRFWEAVKNLHANHKDQLKS